MVKGAMKVAVIGFGGRAEGVCKVAQEQLADRLQFVAVADPKPGRLKRAKKLFGDSVRTYTGGEEFYNDAVPVDGIWIMSQEKTHADLAVPAFEREVPVILEKPLATTAKDAYTICDAYRKHPVPVVIPHSLRYRPEYGKAHEIVQSGKLGRIVHVQAVEEIDDYHTALYYRRGPGMFRSNTTFLLAKSSHDIDIMNWMMNGVKAQSVACFGGADYFKPRAGVPDRCTESCREWETCPFAAKHFPQYSDAEPNDDTSMDVGLCVWNSGAEQVDHQTLILKFEDGTTGTFTLKCFGQPSRPLDITGSHGSLSLSLFSDPHGPSVRLNTYHPPREEVFHYSFGSGPHGGGDLALVEDWLEAAETGQIPSSASIYESAEAVAVCVAADIAMLEHRIVEVADVRNRKIDRSMESPW